MSTALVLVAWTERPTQVARGRNGTVSLSTAPSSEILYKGLGGGLSAHAQERWYSNNNNNSDILCTASGRGLVDKVARREEARSKER